MNEVAILLCTFQGARFLRRQLDTIVAQTHHAWTIYASDDGSSDDTGKILEEYRTQLGHARLRIFRGPQRGFAANFFSLVKRSELTATYYAFADQDDEWLPTKLSKAVEALSAQPERLPALYGSRTELIGSQGAHLGLSRLFKQRPSFANALVQNMVSGNTMVLNDAAFELLRRTSAIANVSAHDWWTYLLVTGSGGTMIYDPQPTLRYRQHQSNLYGENVSLRAARLRVSKLFAGDFRRWNALNIDSLARCSHLLTDRHRMQLSYFSHARRGRVHQRIVNLLRSGVYRQTLDGQLGLLVAAITNRL